MFLLRAAHGLNLIARWLTSHGWEHFRSVFHFTAAALHINTHVTPHPITQDLRYSIIKETLSEIRPRVIHSMFEKRHVIRKKRSREKSTGLLTKLEASRPTYWGGAEFPPLPRKRKQKQVNFRLLLSSPCSIRIYTYRREIYCVMSSSDNMFHNMWESHAAHITVLINVKALCRTYP